MEQERDDELKQCAICGFTTFDDIHVCPNCNIPFIHTIDTDYEMEDIP